MSQEINNREQRKQAIKDMLRQLHEGKTTQDVQDQFRAAFEGVAASEISAAEQALISEGLAVSEVQRLCDVHASVFKGSIEQIHAPKDDSQIQGHPAHTLKAENAAIQKQIDERLRPLLARVFSGSLATQALLPEIGALLEIDLHYSRKENLLFPYLEQHGVSAPPKVMWGVDDEIRAQLKESARLAAAGSAETAQTLSEALNRVEEMIFKEENILIPMLLETLLPEEWSSVARESADIGYCLIDPPLAWQAGHNAAQAPAKAEVSSRDAVQLPTGFLSLQELTRVLDTLPVDITFVGKDDTVRYFSQGGERVFPRTKAIIGRKVANCHPPASVHIVEGIIESFRSGQKDHEDFWIRMGERFVYIRYFAVRDEAGEYLGVLEVTQDIAPIQAITGEKRLVSQV